MNTAKWIQSAYHPSKRGALHRQLNIPQNKTIPKKLLHDIVKTKIGGHSHGHTITRLLKQRALFALNAQKRRIKK